MMHSFSSLLLLMIALAMTGCALPSRSPSVATQSAINDAFRFETRSELPAGPSGRITTALAAQLDTSVVDYKTEYSVTTGSLVQSLADASVRTANMPMDIASQTVLQTVRMDLPSGFGAPVRMGVDWKYDRKLRLDGEKRSESARANLVWAPAPLLLEIEWSAPRRFVVASNPFDCMADGHLRMPLPLAPEINHVAIDLSQRDCLIRAPARGVDGLTMRAQGLSVFLDQEMESFLRLQHVATSDSYPSEDPAQPALEIGLTRNQSWQGWDMQADVAWRQASVPVVPGKSEPTDWWSVDLMLSRQLELVAMSARWMRARDPLWFVPTAAPIGTNRLSMLLDFSAWLTAFVPRMKPKLSASWERRQNADGLDDDRIRWDFSVHW